MLNSRHIFISNYFFLLVIFFAGSVFLGSTSEVSAQSEDQEIASLLEQIAILESQLANLQSQAGFFPGVTPLNFTFNNNLGIGQCHPDVLELQKVLNSDSSTILAQSGPGSPGNETECFGPITRSAVVRFQHKHASEVLHPVGFTSATGFVGPSTRAKLNSILGEDMETPELPDPSEPPPSQETPDPGISLDLETVNPSNYQTQDNFYIQEMGAPTASPGESVSVAGSGFTSNTRAVIGEFLLPSNSVGVSLGSGQTQSQGLSLPGASGLAGFSALTLGAQDSIEIEIPENFPTGVYDLTLIKGQFKTNPSTKILIGNPNVSAPNITAVTQTNNAVRIHGVGLTDSNTVTISGFGRVSNKPASNGVITISKSRLASLFGGLEFARSRSAQVSLFNENGFSDSVSAYITFN